MWYPYNFDIKERPTCRLWNVLSLIRYADLHGSEPAIDSTMKDLKCTIDTLTYNSDGSIDYDAGFTPVDFLTSAEMKTIIRDKYFTFNFATPIYFDYYTEKYEDITDDDNYSNVEMAYREFYKAWSLFCKDNKRNFGTLYDSIFQKYNPISNYDKHSHITLDYKGKETDDTTYAGQETDTLTKSGKELRTETPTGSETDTVTMKGKEKTTNVNGAKTDTTQVSSFDSGNSEWLNKEKVDGAQSTDTSETEYGSSGSTRQDTNVKTFTNRKTEDELSFTNRQDTNTKSFTNRKDTTEKSYTNRQDETNEYTYGNIGVTTTQQMAVSSFQLADLAHLREYIVNEFVKRYLVID